MENLRKGIDSAHNRQKMKDGGTHIAPGSGYRMRITYTLVTIIASLLFGACAGSDTRPAATASAAPSYWPVQLTVSGGFAGFIRHIRVQQDGTVTTGNRQLSENHTSILSADDHRTLAEQLADLPDSVETSGKKATRSNCADCLQYQLTLTRHDKPHTIELNSQTLATSPYSAVIATLVTLMEKHTPTE